MALALAYKALAWQGISMAYEAMACKAMKHGSLY